jgi:hypothetical protein
MKYINYRYSKATITTKLLQLHGNHDTASNVVEETDSEVSIFHVLRIRKPSVEETAKVFRP